MQQNQQVISQTFNGFNPPKLPQMSELEENIENFSLKNADLRSPDVIRTVNILKKDKANVKGLNEKEKLFIAFYLKTRDAKNSAISAGYNPTTAVSATGWLRSNPKANAKMHVFLELYDILLDVNHLAIAQAAVQLAKQKIDAHYVETSLVEQYEKANGDIPYYFKITKDKETGEEIKTPVYKPSAQAALKSLELLGRHKAIKAFDNTIEHTSSDLSNLLNTIKTSFRPPKLTANKTAKLPKPGSIIDGEATIVQNDSPYYPADIPTPEPEARKRGRPPGGKTFTTSAKPYRDQLKGKRKAKRR
jgi:phage terminase small subunit